MHVKLIELYESKMSVYFEWAFQAKNRCVFCFLSSIGSKWKCPFLEFWLCQRIWFNWIVSFDQLNESIFVSCLCNSYIYICSKATFISLDFLNEIHAICYLNDLHFKKKINYLKWKNATIHLIIHMIYAFQLNISCRNSLLFSFSSFAFHTERSRIVLSYFV